MISRRNIRIKVMQSLYALDTNLESDLGFGIDQLTSDHPDYSRMIIKYVKVLDDKIDQASYLFTLSLYYMVRMAQYTEIDANNRASKLLRTEEDLNVSTKFAGNEFVWSLLDNKTFVEAVKDKKLEQVVEKDEVKQLYNILQESEIYKSYVSEEGRTPESDKKMFWDVWTQLMYEHEAFNTLMTEKNEEWEDDKELVYMLIENYVQKRKGTNFLNFISADKKQFAHDLLKTTIDKSGYLMELIHPRLKNWDAERVAQIDLILLKMGIAEFLYFPTVPTKVTINEYIEIAKTYSTPQSSQFINGVLDNILKALEKENKVRKAVRP